MRTDVKIGLVCAFVIVMGAVIYFIAGSGGAAKPTKPTPIVKENNEPPATAPASGALALGNGVTGGGAGPAATDRHHAACC